MIASAYTLAATVCSLAVTVIGMPLGRRNCILLGNLFVVIGGSLQASAWSVPHMIVGRILCVSTPCCSDVPGLTTLQGIGIGVSIPAASNMPVSELIADSISSFPALSLPTKLK